MKPIAVWALLVPLAGEYTVLPTLQRRFLDGEASPQIGVTLLREGATPILCGRPSTAEPRGTLRAGSFKGARYAPRGQEFPSVEGYSAKVSCEASATGAQTVSPGGHGCGLSGLEQTPWKGGLRFTRGACSVTLREVGDYVRVVARNCAEGCGSQAYLEPMLIDRRGYCRLLHAEAR